MDTINGEPVGGLTDLNPKGTVSEKAEDQVAQEKQSEEVVETADQQTPEEPVNFWDAKHYKDENVRKAVQTEFQKKAERVKELEVIKAQYDQQLDQIRQEARAIFDNPEIYHQRRRQFGYADETIPNAQAPKDFSLDGIQTVEDLGNALKQRDTQWQRTMQNEVAKVRSEFESRLGAVAAPVVQQKWEVAISKTREKFGAEFAAKEKEVASLIANGPYKSLYGPLNEEALLEKVFLAEFPHEALKALQSQKKATQDTKKQAVTGRAPKKSATLTPPGGSSKEDVIARINAKYPR